MLIKTRIMFNRKNNTKMYLTLNKLYGKNNKSFTTFDYTLFCKT